MKMPLAEVVGANPTKAPHRRDGLDGENPLS